MNNKDVIGGVTPFKKRSQKFKAGDVGKKATSKNVKLKSGFQRSGMESSGGRNYESLTAGMRVTSSLADSLKFKQPKQPTYGGGGDFEKTGVEDILDPQTEFKTETETKTVKTDKDGNVVTEMGDACSKAYIAKHGDADCIAYKKHRKDNPVDRSKRSSKTVETKKGYYRTRKDKNAEWGPWLPTKGTKYEKK